MPDDSEHRQATRERILTSARRLFNRHGLSDVSIDMVMAGAGLTRGAFYSYFPSKEDLYAEAITLFTRRFPSEPWQSAATGEAGLGAGTDRATNLAETIVETYLSRAHFDDVDGSCPLIGLPGDTARNGAKVRTAYRQVLQMMAGAFTETFGSDRAEAGRDALAMVALCVGAMVLARAVDDPALADELRDAARDMVRRTGGWSDTSGLS